MQFEYWWISLERYTTFMEILLYHVAIAQLYVHNVVNISVSEKYNICDPVTVIL